MRNQSGLTLMFICAAVVCVMTEPAAAYIGPGAGLSGIGALVGVFAAIGIAVLGFVWYPIKRLLHGSRTEPSESCESDGAAGESS